MLLRLQFEWSVSMPSITPDCNCNDGIIWMIKYYQKKKKEIYVYFFLLSSFILGKQTCYSGWKVEYTGFLMTSYKSHNNKQNYVCMDKDSEPIDNNTKNNNEGLFYPVRTTCGSLRCPPYKNHTEMLCVVCTI
jgi:hypothetical protein